MSYPKSPKKLALITGGANGIGLATAQQLAKQNYDLFLIDKDEENLKIAQSKVLSLGAEVQILALDLSDAQETDSVISDLVKRYEFDALVNNAGLGFARTVSQTTQAEWDLTFAVNVTAQFIL